MSKSKAPKPSANGPRTAQRDKHGVAGHTPQTDGKVNGVAPVPTPDPHVGGMEGGRQKSHSDGGQKD